MKNICLFVLLFSYVSVYTQTTSTLSYYKTVSEAGEYGMPETFDGVIISTNGKNICAYSLFSVGGLGDSYYTIGIVTDSVVSEMKIAFQEDWSIDTTYKDYIYIRTKTFRNLNNYDGTYSIDSSYILDLKISKDNSDIIIKNSVLVKSDLKYSFRGEKIIFQNPDIKSKVLTKAEVKTDEIKIIEIGKFEIIDNKPNFWYKVKVKGFVGWTFGGIILQ